LQSLKLSADYKRNERLRVFIRKLLCLAFVPEEFVITEFEKMIDEINVLPYLRT
jgi:hypothetical protein